jgi:hypothetical protein
VGAERRVQNWRQVAGACRAHDMLVPILQGCTRVSQVGRSAVTSIGERCILSLGPTAVTSHTVEFRCHQTWASFIRPRGLPVSENRRVC